MPQVDGLEVARRLRAAGLQQYLTAIGETPRAEAAGHGARFPIYKVRSTIVWANEPPSRPTALEALVGRAAAKAAELPPDAAADRRDAHKAQLVLLAVLNATLDSETHDGRADETATTCDEDAHNAPSLQPLTV